MRRPRRGLTAWITEWFWWVKSTHVPGVVYFVEAFSTQADFVDATPAVYFVEAFSGQVDFREA